ARFLRSAYQGIKRFNVFDTDKTRAAQFINKLQTRLGVEEGAIAGDVASLLADNRMVTLATTALKPHISDLSICKPGTVILHVSLRDISPEAILTCHNVVDDVDHVARAGTSIHLAEQLTGGREFINGTLADVLAGRPSAQYDPARVNVFSPFGLGILDLAVGQ